MIAAAFATTVLIAVLGSLGVGWLALVLLTVLAGILQYLGASMLNKSGKADPSLARASVRRLLQLAARAHAATANAQRVYEEGRAADLRLQMGVLSATLSFIEEDAVQAIADWREFHEDALDQIEGTPDE